MKTLVAVPTCKGGLDDEIHESLVRAETFTIIELEEGEIRKVRVIENPYRQEPHGTGPKVALFLAGLGVNVLLTRVDCPKGKIILDSAGVEVLKVDDKIKVNEALRRLVYRPSGG